MDTSDATVSDTGIQASSRLNPVTSPAAVSPVVQDNTLHEVSQLHAEEVEECAFDQDSNLQKASLESIPRSVPSTAIHHQSLHTYRIFLDICCGLHAPLSAAVRQLFRGYFAA